MSGQSLALRGSAAALAFALVAAPATPAIATPAIATPALATPALAQHAGHGAGHMQDMPGMSGMDHSAHAPATPDEAAAQAAPAPDETAGADTDTPGNAAPPPVPTDHAADAFWDRARMEKARTALTSEGRFSGSAMIVDRLEYRASRGQDGFGWKAMGWIGGDIDRLALDTEGEGRFAAPLETGEVRAAWRHALDPWWNLDLGVRQDFGHGPDRTYAAVGIEGLAPYWFEAGLHAFVSNKGDLHVRAEAEHDLRITQRLILRPSIEIDAAAQDVPELGIGAGLERIELGARLRFDPGGSLAPYMGVHWERALGRTARWRRAGGEPASVPSFTIGVMARF